MSRFLQRPIDFTVWHLLFCLAFDILKSSICQKHSVVKSLAVLLFSFQIKVMFCLTYKHKSLYTEETAVSNSWQMKSAVWNSLQFKQVSSWILKNQSLKHSNEQTIWKIEHRFLCLKVLIICICIYLLSALMTARRVLSWQVNTQKQIVPNIKCKNACFSAVMLCLKYGLAHV